MDTSDKLPDEVILESAALANLELLPTKSKEKYKKTIPQIFPTIQTFRTH